MDVLFFLGTAFLAVFVIGHFLEKLKVPWIFGALLFGLLLVIYNPYGDVVSSETFHTLSDIGLYLLLFLIGFQLNVREIKNHGRFIVKATFLIEVLELLIIGLFIHFVFQTSWFIAFLVALSFATVGEAILLPILDEFNLTKTRLGQTILSIATFDDVFEVFVLVLIVLAGPLLLQTGTVDIVGNFSTLIVLAGLASLVLIFSYSGFLKRKLQIHTHDKAIILFLLLSILFIFVGVGKGSTIDITLLGAILAGFFAQHLLPKSYLHEVESQIKYITFGLFAPIFFLNIGLETDVRYLLENFWLIILIILLADVAKIIGSLLVGRKEFGLSQSLFMGVALGVRFSTSIVILKILLDNQLIDVELYSLLIGTAIVFKFIIPFILGYLGKKMPTVKVLK